MKLTPTYVDWGNSMGIPEDIMTWLVWLVPIAVTLLLTIFTVLHQNVWNKGQGHWCILIEDNLFLKRSFLITFLVISIVPVLNVLISAVILFVHALGIVRYFSMKFQDLIHIWQSTEVSKRIRKWMRTPALIK